jgi:hypothetical protein
MKARLVKESLNEKIHKHRWNYEYDGVIRNCKKCSAKQKMVDFDAFNQKYRDIDDEEYEKIIRVLEK